AANLAWPLVVVVIVIVLRRPLGGISERVGHFRVEAGQVKIETILAGQLSAADLQEVRQKPAQYISSKVVEVTIVGLLLRGGTNVWESLTPDEAGRAMTVIQTYQEAIAAVIRQRGGTVDTTEPERMFCFWGAPIPKKDHAETACLAALDIVAAVDRTKEAIRGRMG